jgi:hypothetical protein
MPYLTPFSSVMRWTKSVESPRNVVLHGSMVIVGLPDAEALSLVEEVTLVVDDLDGVRGWVSVFSIVMVGVSSFEVEYDCVGVAVDENDIENVRMSVWVSVDSTERDREGVVEEDDDIGILELELPVLEGDLLCVAEA